MLTVGGTSAAKHITEAQRHKYLFWDTQPVPKMSKLIKNFVSWDLFKQWEICIDFEILVKKLLY